MYKGYLFCVLAVSAICLNSCHKAQKATHHEPYKVEVVAVDSTSLAQSRTYSGTIEESSSASLSFSVPGTMSRLAVDEGDHVTQGQLIATLDITTLKHAHEMSVAALNEAQDVYDRMKKLHDSNSLSDMKWVEVENALKSAQNAEAISRQSLKDGNLYAPFSGYVAEKFVESGTNVAPGIPIVKIVKINPIKATFSVPESEISSITVGMDAKVTGESLPQSYSGKVTERGVSANPISRAYNVSVELTNNDAKLLPGMICDVQLQKATPSEAIILPNSAVLLDAKNSNYVWLAKNGKAIKKSVETGGLADSGIIISSGLAIGDTVIVHGQQKVSQGSDVTIVNL